MYIDPVLFNIVGGNMDPLLYDLLGHIWVRLQNYTYNLRQNS